MAQDHCGPLWRSKQAREVDSDDLADYKQTKIKSY